MKEAANTLNHVLSETNGNVEVDKVSKDSIEDSEVKTLSSETSISLRPESTNVTLAERPVKIEQINLSTESEPVINVSLHKSQAHHLIHVLVSN